MKMLKTLYAGLIGLLVAFASCTDDIGVQSTNVPEGMPAKVELNVDASPLGKVQVTRAGEDEGNFVYDLYIFIFDKNKVLKTKVYYSDADFEGSKTLAPIQTTSGESYIMAVGNIKEGMPSEYRGSAVRTALDGAEVGTFTIDDLKSIQLSLRANNADALNRQNGTFTMAGAYVPPSGTEEGGDGYCVIPESDTTMGGSIKLYRTDAWITFNISIGSSVNKPEDATYEPSFIAESFRVFNIPTKSSLTNQPTDYDGASVSQSADYYDISEADPVIISDKITINNTTYETFSFYMMENRKSPVAEPDGGWTYAAREKQKKEPAEGNSVVNGDWMYAPKYATYVAISGQFHGYDDDGHPVDAEVIYKIHLGNLNNGNDDFNTMRNRHYTYTVTVNGVDDIIVEVETNEEKQPGATGDVYYSDNTKVYYLDAHYEACLMEFYYNDLIGNYRGKINYLVNTPFTKYGVDKSEDANWVRFAVNDKQQNTYSMDLQAYENPDQMMTVDDLIEHLNEMSKDSNHVDWLGTGDNKKFVVTCFVNEYYYTYDSEEEGYQSDAEHGGQYAVPSGASIDRNVPAWKYVVNQPNRNISLLCDIRSSADGESSIINAAYVISQRSIQTFYNADPSVTGLTSALGLETINETGTQLNEMGNPRSTSSDYRDGWTNSKNMWNVDGNGQWNTYIDYAANGYKDYRKTVGTTDETVDYIGLRSNYQKAYIACLQRNRDVNGNGRIDEDEIKWYLPALNQYGAIFMGAGALSAESRLYQDADWHLKHYFSSTYDTRDNVYDVMTVWAEEGFSISTAAQTDRWITDAKRDPDIVRRVYRCVRNIGNIKHHGQDYPRRHRPQNYWFQDESNEHLINFIYLDKDALRTFSSTENELSGSHNQNSDANRVFASFEYAVRDADHIIDRREHNEPSYTPLQIRNEGTEICSSYEQDGHRWRIPNHRELLFMTLNGQNQVSDQGLLPDFPTRVNGTYPYTYGCRTIFRWATTPTQNGQSSPLDGKTRYGYRVEANGNMSLTNGWSGEHNRVRCVRDVE